VEGTDPMRQADAKYISLSSQTSQGQPYFASTSLPENKAVCQMPQGDNGRDQISSTMGSLYTIRHEEADLAAARSLAGLSLLLC